MIKKLIYRSTYRGCKEMDFLLSRFAAKELHLMNDVELKNYSDFLDSQDPDIYDWVLDKQETPREFQEIVEKIKLCNS